MWQGAWAAIVIGTDCDGILGVSDALWAAATGIAMQQEKTPITGRVSPCRIVI